MTDIEDTPSTEEAASSEDTSSEDTSSEDTSPGDAPPEDAPPEDTPTSKETRSSRRVPDNTFASNPDDKTVLLHELVATIRASVAPGVTPEARAAGAAACRAILSALEAKVGQPLVATTSGPTTHRATPEPSSPVARILSQFVGMPREQLTGLLSQLAAMPREQLIDFLSNRLRSALPPGTQPRVSAGPRFHLIQIPQIRPPGSGT